MRRRVLVPVALLMLTGLCVGGWFLLVRRQELSSAEYDVLSGWVTAKVSGWVTAKVNEQPDNRARKLFILSTTDSFDPHYPMDASGQPIPWAKWLQAEAPPTLQTTTIEAFLKANKHQAIIRPSFHIAIDYGLVDSAQLEPIFKKGGGDWPAYFKEFPGSQGILTLSRVGFNADGTQALLYWSNRCGGLCGGRGYAVMERRNGRWLIVAEIRQYVS